MPNEQFQSFITLEILGMCYAVFSVLSHETNSFNFRSLKEIFIEDSLDY